jgi:SAM-dependent methyltransferase
VTFGPEYAAAYDLLYQDKDYAAECDLIEQVFALYAHRPVRRVLDLGCGTGGHAAPLAERGYEVVGVDHSEDMLRHARVRGSSARFERSEIASADLGAGSFDAVLMMFAVLGYQLGNHDLLAALTTARRHLNTHGLLFGDAWYGPAVLHQRPGERVKVLDTPNGQVIRVASGELDPRHHVCTVRYHVWRIEAGRVATEAVERHRMRYFFPLELELLLRQIGFELVRLGSFPELDRDPDETTWNVGFVARAV